MQVLHLKDPSQAFNAWTLNEKFIAFRFDIIYEKG